ncbi:MAG: transcription elongation factor GreA [Oscillospiraceae bacterium]
MAKEILISRSGLKALEDELDDLKTNKRKEIAEKIKVALFYGDLSENSEYDSAKNEQAITEARIAEIEAMLKVAKVIDAADVSTESVSVGTTVEIQDTATGEKEKYSIVSPSEADIFSGKLSDESAVGTGLIGKKKGETAEIVLPNGKTVSYKILKIEMTPD